MSNSVLLWLFLSLLLSSCSGQSSSHNTPVSPVAIENPAAGTPVAEYVVETFEDTKGNLWFGTMERGVARYDGHKLTYFTTKDGLVGNTVTSIVEDAQGNLWFGTHSGLSRYDGNLFTNFTRKDGLIDDRVANLLIDRSGQLWIGTWGGVCRFNGFSFSDFPVPKPAIDLQPYQNTQNWVSELLEDRHGNIWFGRDGYGACKYDGTTFTHFTQKDGLPSNAVQAMAEDQEGHIWFGCRVLERDHPDPEKRKGAGGLCRFDGKNFLSFPGMEGLHHNDVYSMLSDKSGKIWIGATGLGIYCWDGQNFNLFKGTDRMDLTHSFGVQSILEDRHGRLWFGFSGGLFRLNGSAIVHVGVDGPWE